MISAMVKYIFKITSLPPFTEQVISLKTWITFGNTFKIHTNYPYP